MVHYGTVLDVVKPEYFEHSDPMLDEHRRTLDPACICDYTPIKFNQQTVKIRRDVDPRCPVHAVC